MAQETGSKEAAKILVVDDVDSNRFVLRDIIQEMGCQPVLTENGAQALKMVGRLQPQLIILDVAMPEMTKFFVILEVAMINTSFVSMVLPFQFILLYLYFIILYRLMQQNLYEFLIYCAAKNSALLLIG